MTENQEERICSRLDQIIELLSKQLDLQENAKTYREQIQNPVAKMIEEFTNAKTKN